MKKVTSNVKLNMYASTDGVNHYEGVVKLGDVDTKFLVDTTERDTYVVVMEHDVMTQLTVKGHTMPVSFLDIELEEERVAKVARYALSTLLWEDCPGLHHLAASPYERTIGMEHGINDKVVIYNILTDRVSKRRV